jgi:hypothetical protein
VQILIDYDNLPERVISQGLAFVVEQAVQRAARPGSTGFHRAHARLYGGWYGGPSLTANAQLLVAEIFRDFPRVVPLSLDGTLHRVVATAELALSMVCAPSEHLWDTYRRKAPPQNLKSAHPIDLGCRDINCPLVGVHEYIKTRRCPSRACAIDVGSMIYRGQQKMVDTMLAVDLLHHAREPDVTGQPIVLISNDHDYWPPMRAALHLGSPVTQVDPRTTQPLPEYYTSKAGPQFRSVFL